MTRAIRQALALGAQDAGTVHYLLRAESLPQVAVEVLPDVAGEYEEAMRSFPVR